MPCLYLQVVYASPCSVEVTIRCHRRRRLPARSMPPNSSASSSWLSTTFACPLAASGHRKRPFSKRFAHTHSPLPSQNSSFTRLRCAFENRKTCPLIGSHNNRSRTCLLYTY